MTLFTLFTLNAAKCGQISLNRAQKDMAFIRRLDKVPESPNKPHGYLVPRNVLFYDPFNATGSHNQFEGIP